jgi:hypothetical protein
VHGMLAPVHRAVKVKPGWLANHEISVIVSITVDPPDHFPWHAQAIRPNATATS